MQLFTSLAAKSTPERISRAASLVALDKVLYVEEWRPGIYKAVVRGDSGLEHIVILSKDGSRYKCTCYDYAKTRKPCKHILAVAFYLGLVEKKVSRNLRHHALRESRDHHPSTWRGSGYPRAPHGASANSAIITARANSGGVKSR